ncbi:unnamed protein product [Rotaria magnacalcarata]|nr:unnamed protein product [Rotaria magnacalcarata]CAF1664355.1 unnamed protein product [Rotaria magnacalcarata]CAF4375029.1 unnamed protein product [Rotaria magnacalcarata]CAF4390222.1 unnamed protein product [Rotaria magnacalcarata]
MSSNEDKSQFDIDSLIELLLGDQMGNISEETIKILCAKSKEIFLRQPILLELEPPLKVCGNICGFYDDLLQIFASGGVPSQTNYLFLGNYVDRGKQSIKTICLLLAYKIKYSDKLFLLRGNHECSSINRIYGFYAECRRRYSIKLWKSFNECFNCLPVAAIVGKKIFCCQGGLSPELSNLDQIRQIQRPTDVPDTGLLCDLLWADPDNSVQDWCENDAGVSCRFGINVLSKFLNRHNMDLVCRSHQVVENGYEFFGNRQLVTIFSIRDYMGEFDNASAIMSINENLMCSFTVFKSRKKQSENWNTGGYGIISQTMSCKIEANNQYKVHTADSNQHVKWADMEMSTSLEEHTLYSLYTEI